MSVLRATPKDRQTAAFKDELRNADLLVLPDLESFVPELVRALGDSEDGVVTAAHAALVQVTRAAR